jgi:cation diffusion facilitator family transporter
VAVLLLKLAAWGVTGSVAVLSDAVESIVNVAAALLALGAIRLAEKPADAEHPFGHHKAEVLSAVFEGVLIVLAALFILRAVWLAEPMATELPVAGLVLLALATAINAAWARTLLARGTALGSPALVADGRHLWADVVTTLGVAAGVVLAALTGLWWLDPVIAVGVALHVLWSGWQMVRASLSSLMDEALPPEILARVTRILAKEATGALQIHDLKTRVAGRASFIEFHLIVPGDMPVSAAHDICDRLEEALADALPGAETVIHLEPDSKAETEQESQGAIIRPDLQ